MPRYNIVFEVDVLTGVYIILGLEIYLATDDLSKLYSNSLFRALGVRLYTIECKNDNEDLVNSW